MIYLEFEQEDFESIEAFVGKAVCLLGLEVLRQREYIHALEAALREHGIERPERKRYNTIAPF